MPFHYAVVYQNFTPHIRERSLHSSLPASPAALETQNNYCVAKRDRFFSGVWHLRGFDSCQTKHIKFLNFWPRVLVRLQFVAFYVCLFVCMYVCIFDPVGEPHVRRGGMLVGKFELKQNWNWRWMRDDEHPCTFHMGVPPPGNLCGTMWHQTDWGY